jgi:predicted peptidase
MQDRRMRRENAPCRRPIHFLLFRACVNTIKGTIMMRFSSKKNAVTFIFTLMLLLLFTTAGARFVLAQPAGGKPMPKMPITIEPDPRVEQRNYHFSETDEKLTYVLFVSSKVSKDKKNPLIVALHGMGGDGNFLVRDRLVDLAEEGGYIVVGPLGYNVSGWYGSPVIAFGNQPVEPPNLAELSEKDVMNVLAMMREEFTIDPARTYLMGHSMGGAGTLYLGSKHTSEWTALAVIAPAAFLMEKDRAEYLTRIKNAGIPIMLIQGGSDTVVPAKNTRQWSETMKELKMDHKYIEFEGGDHGDIIGNGMPDIFEFFKKNAEK